MNTVNDAKMIIWEKHEKVNITFCSWRKMKVSWKKRVCHVWGLLKNKVPQLFLRKNISSNFIDPSLSRSEKKFQKNICFKIMGPHYTLKSPCKLLDLTSAHQTVNACLIQKILLLSIGKSIWEQKEWKQCKNSL